jgi:hypothetical protein
MTPSKYTFEDLNAGLRQPLVNLMMRRQFALNSTDFDVPGLAGYSTDFKTIYIARILPHWPFLGRQIPVKSFVLMRVLTQRALAMALTEVPVVLGPDDPDLHDPPPNSVQRLSQELEFLCITLRMVGLDDHRAENIAEFAKAAECHAVAMMTGLSGVASYTKWLDGLTPHADTLPPDLVAAIV